MGWGVLQNKACRKIFGYKNRGSDSNNVNSVYEYEGFYLGYAPMKGVSDTVFLRFDIDVYAWKWKRETLARVHIQQQLWKASCLTKKTPKTYNL
jgi:hypothetical protein